MRILIDLDEVLCDFVGGACAAWGLTKEEVLKYWPIGKWDIIPPLRRTIAEKLVREKQIHSIADFSFGDNEFWSRINNNPDFWISLQPLPWMDKIIELVSSYTDDWLIVTAPSRCPSSSYGKVSWLKNVFGSKFTRFVITTHKYTLAMPGVLLIDDRDSNLRSFCYKDTKILTGGKGIVFPCYHSSTHKFIGREIEYLRAKLDELIVDCNAPKLLGV